MDFWAGLHLGLRKNGGDRVRKALQAIDDRDQDVLDAAILEFVHDPQPEFGAIKGQQAFDPIRVPSMFDSLAVEVLYPA